MSVGKWVSDHAIAVVTALLAINFIVISWGAVNWGLYSIRNSTAIFRLDAVRTRKSPQLGNPEIADPERAPVGSGQAGPVSGPDLILTCDDDDLASAFASIRPAVVNITADRVTRRTGGSLTAGSVTFDNPAIRFVEEQSLGSGIVVDPRGFILSNAHVVSAAQSLKVITFGFERREYKAELVAKNTAMDIAILRIRPVRPLVAAVLGDSDMLRVAERVIAIGSPFGLEQTVTAGIISDTSRNLIIEGNTYEEMIQTDAAINRGNSGGPLVNLKGEVIGINTAIYAPTGVFTGVGFAIPVNRIRPLVKEVLANRNT